MPATNLRAYDGKVADLTQAEHGRRIINEVEYSMGGLLACRNQLSSAIPLKGVRITGVLHMTAETAVLIESLSALGADLRWCSSNAFSTRDSVAAALAKAQSAAVFAWKGQTLQEYWWCIKQACTWPDGTGPNIILDTGGDLGHLIHTGVEYELSCERAGPPSSHLSAIESEEESPVVLTILREQHLQNPSFWREMVKKLVGVCEQTSSGVHRLQQREANGNLLFQVMSINDCIMKSNIENIYGIKHSVVKGLFCALDIMLAGKTVLVCGFGDVGKGCAAAMKAAGARCIVSEMDPIRALIAGMEGYQVAKLETVLSEIDIFITATGSHDVIHVDHMLKMKKNAVVGNMGHFRREIDLESLRQYPGAKVNEVRPNVHQWVFPDGHSIILLAEGRLLNLICGTGNPSFVMSIAFTLQVLTQVHLWKSRNLERKSPAVRVPPKTVDTQAALYHLSCINAELTATTNNSVASNGWP